MKKNVVKINENTLKQIVSESVKKVLTESVDEYFVSGNNPGVDSDTDGRYIYQGQEVMHQKKG